MRVTFLQIPLVWENPQANLKALDGYLAQAQATDLVILPEMFTTGFSMNPQNLAEKHQLPTLSWMREKAKSLQAAITGSIMYAEGERYYNRLFWVEPNGRILHYDKRHRFSMAGEDKVYTAGQESLIIEYQGWRIMPLICYDLRFPVWSRNQYDYDVLIYVANWPERRIQHWDTLLRARAIENQAYVLGVNCVGRDGLDLYYNGSSAAVSPLGEVLYQVLDRPELVELTLSKSDLAAVRERFPFLRDRDQFELK
jgi:predicted amidohydrolase